VNLRTDVEQIKDDQQEEATLSNHFSIVSIVYQHMPAIQIEPKLPPSQYSFSSKRPPDGAYEVPEILNLEPNSGKCDFRTRREESPS
jgi:hypothetical protein